VHADAEADADVCVCVCVCVCDGRMSPLHVAVLQDSVQLISLLLQHGAPVDCADNKGPSTDDHFLPSTLIIAVYTFAETKM